MSAINIHQRVENKTLFQDFQVIALIPLFKSYGFARKKKFVTFKIDQELFWSILIFPILQLDYKLEISIA